MDLASTGAESFERELSTDGSLERGALGLRQTTSTSLAQIAPALGLYFNIALIAGSVGAAAPVAVLLGALGIAGTAYTLANFARTHPAVGSFINYIVKGCGSWLGTTLALPLQAGYILLNAGTVIALGVWIQELLARWADVAVPWQPISLAGGAILYGVMIVGVKATVRAAMAMFVFEVAILVALALFTFSKAHVTTAPLTVHSGSGIKGFGLAFVLSLYMFIGWEAPVTFSEETQDPRRTIPRAILIGLVIATVIYAGMAFAMITGFGPDHMTSLANDSAPFDTVARRYGGTPLRLAIDIAGLTSICGSVLASAASQGRTLFEMGRIGMVSSRVSRVGRRYRTPHAALLTYFALTAVIILVWGSLVNGGLNVFGQVATLGTIPVVVTYMAVNIAAIVHACRGGRIYRRPALGIAVASFGTVAMAYPLWQLVQPGQAAPYNRFPIIVLAATVIAGAYSLWLIRRRPAMAQRVEELLAG